MNIQTKLRIGIICEHYKGTLYRVENFAQDATTGKEVVIYENEKSELFVRSLEEFCGVTEKGMPRFMQVNKPFNRVRSI